MMPGLEIIVLVAGGLALVYLIADRRFSAPHYHGPVSDHFTGERFRNLEPSKPRGFIDFFRWRLTSKRGPWNKWTDSQPGSVPPRRVNGKGLRVTFINHATVLIQTEGLNVVTDPIWSERASPVRWAGPKRHRSPGLKFEDLPPIDIVLISHDHYDHLDVATVTRLARTHRPRFLVPLGLRAWFTELGITEVDELDWWQSRAVAGLTLTCVPAQHFSGRTPWDRNRRLWGGWTVAGRAKRLYFAGDTAYYHGLKEIGARLGPFDVAAIPIGAYLPPVIMQASHTTPEEALQVLADVRGRHLVPIHWGTFDLAEEPMEEPPARLLAEARRLGLGSERVSPCFISQTRRW